MLWGEGDVCYLFHTCENWRQTLQCSKPSNTFITLLLLGNQRCFVCFGAGRSRIQTAPTTSFHFLLVSLWRMCSTSKPRLPPSGHNHWFVKRLPFASLSEETGSLSSCAIFIAYFLEDITSISNSATPVFVSLFNNVRLRHVAGVKTPPPTSNSSSFKDKARPDSASILSNISKRMRRNSTSLWLCIQDQHWGKTSISPWFLYYLCGSLTPNQNHKPTPKVVTFKNPAFISASEGPEPGAGKNLRRAQVEIGDKRASPNATLPIK